MASTATDPTGIVTGIRQDALRVVIQEQPVSGEVVAALVRTERDADLDPNRVFDALGALAKAGLVTREPRGDGGFDHRSTYDGRAELQRRWCWEARRIREEQA